MPKFLVQYYYYYEIFNYFIYSKNGNSTFNNTIFENNEGIEFSIWGSKFKTDFIESDNSNIFIYDSKFLNNMQLGTLFNCEETFSNVTIDNTSFIHNKENYQSTRKLNILNINNSNFISNEIGIQANIINISNSNLSNNVIHITIRDGKLNNTRFENNTNL